MNNYRQPYSRGSVSCGTGQRFSDTARCSCQNTVTVEASCACPPKVSPECACAVACAVACEPCERDDMPGFPLGMAYVPWQPWCNLYDTEQALWKGTLFQDLDLDFLGRRCS